MTSSGKRVKCITCGNHWALEDKLQCPYCVKEGSKSVLRAVPPINPIKTVQEFTGSADPTLVGKMDEAPVSCLLRHTATGEIVLVHNFVLIGFQGSGELTVINLELGDLKRAKDTIDAAYEDMLSKAPPEVRKRLTKEFTKDLGSTSTVVQNLAPSTNK